MRSFDDLVSEAAAAEVAGWGFNWLKGRATEERPPWGYAKLLAKRLTRVESALDLDTGGGEGPCRGSDASTADGRDRGMATQCRARTRAARSARRRGRRDCRGCTPTVSGRVVRTGDGTAPGGPNWAEIHRVLVPGGHYFAQHVGPASAFELIEHFLGPRQQERKGRDPQRESAAAQDVGLVVTDLRTARCRIAFYDVGAVVRILRKCVWWVPDFSIEKYLDKLAELDVRMRSGEPVVVAHSTRHLIEAQRPTSQ